MHRLRTLAVAAAAVFALVAAPQDAQAQVPVKFGVHVANATDVADGTWGLGARVGIDPPVMPLSFFGTVDYFFPDCGDGDCGYQNFAVDANFTPLPFPMVDVYLTGGLLLRRLSIEDASETFTGFSLGAGVAFNFVASAYLEARNEFFSDEDGGNQILIRLGLLF